MSKLIKVALILAVAAVAIAAKQYTSPGLEKSAAALSGAPGIVISPDELTRAAGPLPETKVDSHF